MVIAHVIELLFFYFKYWFDRCNTERQSSHLLLHFTNACNSQGLQHMSHHCCLSGTALAGSCNQWTKAGTKPKWCGMRAGILAAMPKCLLQVDWVPTTHREDLDCILSAHFSPWPKTTLCGLLGSKPTHKYSHLSVAQVSKIVTKHISFYVHHHGAIVFKA